MTTSTYIVFVKVDNNKKIELHAYGEEAFHFAKFTDK